DPLPAVSVSDRDAVNVEKVGSALGEPTIVLALVGDTRCHDNEKAEHGRVISLVNSDDRELGKLDEPGDLLDIRRCDTRHARLVDGRDLIDIGWFEWADEHARLLASGNGVEVWGGS